MYWTLLFYKQGFNPINGKFSFWRVIIGFISVFGHFRKRIVTLCVINQPKKSLCILKYFCLCPTLHRSFQNAPNFFKIWQILVVLYKPSLKFEVDRYVKSYSVFKCNLNRYNVLRFLPGWTLSLSQEARRSTMAVTATNCRRFILFHKIKPDALADYTKPEKRNYCRSHRAK